MTGAGGIARLLAARGTRMAFAYPGTSELALCDALAAAGIDVLNGRGDAESVFLAAGANLAAPGSAVAVLHAARGLTSAAGAIAALRRNEIPLVCLVGLPYSRTRRYLPPHEEPRLIASVRAFAKDAFEGTDVARAAERSLALPPGPVVVGTPQDVLEEMWEGLQPVQASAEAPPTSDLAEAVAAVDESRDPLLLVDDPFFRRPGAVRALAAFAARIAAPVLQVRYRRGAMLFQQLTRRDTPLFAGLYDPADPLHARLMASTDLLITVEDRNVYPRVTGPLPRCRKLALTSSEAMTRKNRYLRAGDVLVAGDPVAALARMRVKRRRAKSVAAPHPPPEGWRRALVAALAEAMRPEDVLIDDSQMFGGLLAEHYDLLPHGLRVIGDHAALIGSGTGYATGYALAGRAGTVFCTAGDSGFANGVKALYCAAERRAHVVFVVANNGGAVSLETQLGGSRPYLANAPNLDYRALASAVGIPSERIDAATPGDAFRRAAAAAGPFVLELVLPPAGPAWDGIWATSGLDNLQAGEDVPAANGRTSARIPSASA